MHWVTFAGNSPAPRLEAAVLMGKLTHASNQEFALYRAPMIKPNGWAISSFKPGFISLYPGFFRSEGAFVVFSLFGKKNPPPKKPENKPAPAKPQGAKPSAASQAPAPLRPSAAEGDNTSLDFTGFVPVKRESPAAARTPPPRAAPRADPMRNTDGMLEIALSSTPAPSSTPAVSAPPSTPARPRVPDSIMSIEVTAPPTDLAPIIEETAVLFANGQVDEALAKLGRSVREEDLGSSELQCWLMLFDLYLHLGMQIEFEALALEFVVKFERSPPAWMDKEIEPRSSPATVTGGTGHFAFSSPLSAASDPEFGKLRGLVEKLQTVRVDFGRVQEIDAAGADRLRDLLLELRFSGKEIVLTGEAQLIRLLEEACQAGKVETDGALWSLLFEICRWFGLQEKFEDSAVNYAVTFEVSPPSWETPAPGAGKPKKGAAGTDSFPQALVLSGEITGAGEALAKQLQDWAAVNSMLVIDMSKVRRVDFVSAGLMLNIISKLYNGGTTIQIRGANELVVALFQVMGVGNTATMVRHK